MKKLFISICLFLAISSVYAQNFVPDPNKFYNIVESTSNTVIGVGAAGSQPALTVKDDLASQAFKFVPTGATDTYYLLSSTNLYLNVNNSSAWASVAEAAINGTKSEWVIEGADATTGIRLKNNGNLTNLDANNVPKQYLAADGTPTGAGQALWTDKYSDNTNGLYKLQEATIIATTTLYSENFEANLASGDATATFAPTTKAGTWSGGANLETAGDAVIMLNKGWGNNYHLLQLDPTSAAVTIPNINVAGYMGLSLSFQFTIAGAPVAPNVEASVDGGAWASLPTVSTGGWWSLGTQSVALPAAVSTISLRINPPTALSTWFDNFAITGRVATVTQLNQLSDNSFKVYPNPATNYILTKNAQKVTITDLNGRLVKEAFNADKVDVSSLAKGVYIVKVNVDKATKIGKLIKE